MMSKGLKKVKKKNNNNKEEKKFSKRAWIKKTIVFIIEKRGQEQSKDYITVEPLYNHQVSYTSKWWLYRSVIIK